MLYPCHIGVVLADLCYNFSEIAWVTVLYLYPYLCFLGQLVCYDLNPQCSSLSPLSSNIFFQFLSYPYKYYVVHQGSISLSKDSGSLCFLPSDCFYNEMLWRLVNDSLWGFILALKYGCMMRNDFQRASRKLWGWSFGSYIKMF